MKALPHPDNLYLDAATGWLMLGDPKSAMEELERLSKPSRSRPEVLEMEWSVHALLQSWKEAYTVADRLVGSAPQLASGWIHRAYSARRMPGGGLEQAWEVLRPAYEKFPSEEVIAYNLACYAAQLGRLKEAWEWLERAGKAAGSLEVIKKRALADNDLEGLWPKLAGL
jgi:hypothetical protein